MIITRLLGGLGNQMFQYAIGRALALRHDAELKLDCSLFTQVKGITPRSYSLSQFTIDEQFVTDQDLSRIKYPKRHLQNLRTEISGILRQQDPLEYIKERGIEYHRDFPAWPDNVCLEGYWQSEKYFLQIRETLLRDFSIPAQPDTENERISQSIRASESVSIHIRRGDYITDTTTFNHHGTCSLAYYRKGIEYINGLHPDTEFYIFSDDPDWVRQNLRLENPHMFVVNNLNKADYWDLWLMIQCRHHIIANSSFSWWGAWLSDSPEKIVVAPKKWLNTPALDTRDVIPESWCRM